jgi:hypothetical protein
MNLRQVTVVYAAYIRHLRGRVVGGEMDDKNTLKEIVTTYFFYKKET